MAEAISLARELNEMHALALGLCTAAMLAYLEGNPAEVERLASEAIELSTRQSFAQWLSVGIGYRGWALSVFGQTGEGISLIEKGIPSTGFILTALHRLGVRAEALHLADRTSEALETVNEAEALVERTEERWFCAELHRLRGVFLAAMGAEETDIEASFRAAIKIAKEQKSVSLTKRAKATYAEYRREKASAPRGSGFRLPLR
jgi:hypothetical protein